mgnify:CR=1 FL=1
MTVQINYKNSSSKKNSSNLVLFVDEKFNISGLKKYISNIEFSYISDLLKTSDLKKDILSFEINSKKTIFLVSIKKNIKISDIENLGAKFHGHIDYKKRKDYFVNSDTINSKIKNLVGHFLHGLKLKSYEFTKYKSKKEKRIININVVGNKNKPSNLKSIDQLFENDLASVQEIGIEGRVEEVRVNNFSKDFLFISDGEAIVGAKQNRITNSSFVIGPNCTTTIPVSCVEQNRWDYNSRIFAASENIIFNKELF